MLSGCIAERQHQVRLSALPPGNISAKDKVTCNNMFIALQLVEIQCDSADFGPALC